jgi:hypothetical protein
MQNKTLLITQENCLLTVAKELLKSFPIEGRRVVIVVHLEGLREVAGILPIGLTNYEVRFVQPSSEFPQNTVHIEYADQRTKGRRLTDTPGDVLETM